MVTALAKNNKSGNPRLNYFKKEIDEGNLEYIDTKRVLRNNIPQRDLRGVNLSPTAVISNTLTESITKILYNVKTEKDLAKLKAGNPSYYQEGKQIEKGKIDLLSNGQRLITLFQTADESTFAHEMCHMFLMDLEELAKIDDKSAKELGIIPAYAGKTGEIETPNFHPSGSPPLTRERHSRHRAERLAAGITPAYAGKTVAESGILPCVRDHPRLRGKD